MVLGERSKVRGSGGLVQRSLCQPALNQLSPCVQQQQQQQQKKAEYAFFFFLQSNIINLSWNPPLTYWIVTWLTGEMPKVLIPTKSRVIFGHICNPYMPKT